MLQALGWIVLSVPFYDYFALKSPRSKVGITSSRPGICHLRAVSFGPPTGGKNGTTAVWFVT